MTDSRTPLLFALGLLLGGAAHAGDLDAPAGPDDPGSAMYRIDDIYNRLDTGAAGTLRTTPFAEPVAGPAGTGHTLTEVMGKAPAVDDTDGAGPADVLSGKTYWGLQSGAWGPQTGTYTAADGGGCDCSSGTLTGTRWCDNGDGTVTDLLGDDTNANLGRCLVWMKDATCSAVLGTISKTGSLNWDDATIWSSAVIDGSCGLTDGSSGDEWRLPTKAELVAITHGTEPILFSSTDPFLGVTNTTFWSSTTKDNNPARAWLVYTTSSGSSVSSFKSTSFSGVWPVRGGQ